MVNLKGIAGHYSQAGTRLLELSIRARLSHHLLALGGGLMPPGGPRHISLTVQKWFCAPSAASKLFWQLGCLGRSQLAPGSAHGDAWVTNWECSERGSQSKKAKGKGWEMRKGERQRRGVGLWTDRGGATMLEPIRELLKASTVKKLQTQL